jgi:hypothetical protein
MVGKCFPVFIIITVIIIVSCPRRFSYALTFTVTVTPLPDSLSPAASCLTCREKRAEIRSKDIIIMMIRLS